MKKRFIAIAASAAVLVGGAVAVIPGGSAHGLTQSQCLQIGEAMDMQGSQAGTLIHLTPKQQQQGLKALDLRFGQLATAGCI